MKWLRAHDPGLSALRRATRAAIVMPAMFALGDVVIGNPMLATFAAFGSFALLLLVDFTGPMRDRLFAQAALGGTGAVLVVVGTLASQSTWTAALSMAIVGFAVAFAGVVSSVLASATFALLLAYILPVSLAGPASSIPDRLAGWGLATAGSLVAITFLWPAPTRDPLRHAAAAACRGLAERLRAQVAQMLGQPGPDLEDAVARSDEAVGRLRSLFFATPYRPTGLSTSARAIVRLVDEIAWLNAIVVAASPRRPSPPGASRVLAVKTAAADLLDQAGATLETVTGDPEPVRAGITQLREALVELEQSTTLLPDDGAGAELVSALDPGFRAQELAFAVSQIAENVELAVRADRRSWLDEVLGRQPSGLAGPLSAAQERAAGHVRWSSVWLRNSIRAGIALGLAVGIAAESGVQHSFWVVLGTLSVLRSSALNTGQNILRALAGTAVGFAVGGLLVAMIGTNTTVLWVLLPISILFAGFAPAAISFAAGQAGFTVTLLILFNIIQPAGWGVGLVRIEDVAIGFAVSLGVGLIVWPRGAAAALGRALDEAYAASAGYLEAAVEFALACCDRGRPRLDEPAGEATSAAAAARRLDDAFRTYLAERGTKPAPLADVTTLVTGVVALRLAADAVVDLWRGDRDSERERAEATLELLPFSTAVTAWYADFGHGIDGRGAVPDPLPSEQLAQDRLVEAVRHDLADGHADIAVRIVWTGDHIETARRLQSSLVVPARSLTGGTG
jgi:uncharacterized membrane protein YccC